jgi:hypothetical protein
MAVHTTNQRLTPLVYEEMKVHGKARLKPSKILPDLKKTHTNEVILAAISTIYTSRKKSQEELLQGISLIVHLNKTLNNTNFTTAKGSFFLSHQCGTTLGMNRACKG